ncbi:zf-C3HC4-domain-containing protein [Abortiporus biennis]|nr:zf-C3HC4-domain-containing protein [Abortiporus biennis]
MDDAEPHVQEEHNSHSETQDNAPEEKQCRICLQLDGEDPSLGRLIRPCLCKGSMTYVHVKCLQTWRTASASKSAFYSCPQCHYNYHFARTRAVGIATNPVVVGVLSAFLFTLLVFAASFVTTWFTKEAGSDNYYYFTTFDLFRSLVRTAVRYLTEGDFEDRLLTYTQRKTVPTGPPGLLKRLLHRFLLGLPVVGAGSVVHMLFSIPMPLSWIRYRVRRMNRDTRDMATLFLLAVVIIGALRALWKVYQLTEKLVHRLLLRAEEAIVEVG